MSCKSAIIWCEILFTSFVTIENTKAQSIRDVSTRPIQAGARAVALGDAYISDPYDVNSVYWNPASLAFLETYSVAANSIINMDNSIFKSNVALPYRVDATQTVALGVAANYLGYFSFHCLDLGYAKRLTPDFSAGIFIDFGYASSRSNKLWRGSGSLGVLYAPSPGVSYAFVCKGIGTEVRYSYDGIQENLEHINPEQSILLGTTFWFPSINRRPYLNISLVAEKVLGVKNFTSKAGIEYWPLPFIAARLGIVSKPSAATGRIGLGLLMGRYRFNYAISPSAVDERTHQISIAVLI